MSLKASAPLLLLFFLVLASTTAFGHDIISPNENQQIATNTVSVQITHQFQEEASCTLDLDDTQQTSYNTTNQTITINITADEGEHLLNSMCELSNRSSTIQRSFTVDLTTPSFAISPDLNTTTLPYTPTTQLTVTPTEEASITVDTFNDSITDTASPSTPLTITLPLQVGTNTVIVTAADTAGNEHAEIYTFETDNSCTNGIIDDEEDNIDCGGMCDACLPYDVRTDKKIYELGEQVDISVIARQDSNHTITVTGPGTSFSSSNTGIGGYITIPEKEGLYTIFVNFNYLNNKQNITTNFTVINLTKEKVDCSIKASQSSASPGQVISFESLITGGTPPYRVAWDFDEDYVIDSTTSKQDHVYTTTGKRSVWLKVNDSRGISDECSRYITIKTLHRLQVELHNNITGSPLSGLSVVFDEDTKTTNSEGKTSFELLSGTYLLQVTSEIYSDYFEDIILDENITLNISLRELNHDLKPPFITILEPYDEQEFESDPVYVKYTATDKSSQECKHSKGEYSNIFETVSDWHDVENGTMQTFTISGLPGGKSYWKVECKDVYGNMETAQGSIILPADPTEEETPVTTEEDSVNVETDDNGIKDFLPNIEQIETSYAKFGEDEQKFMEVMSYKDRIKNQQQELKQISRDLFNLQYKRMNEEEKQEERDALIDRSENIMNSIIQDVEVTEHRYYVKYNDEQDTELFTLLYLDTIDDQMQEKHKSKLIKANQDIQPYLTASTHLYLAKLTLLDGTTQEITVVSKEFELDEKVKNAVLLEIIPKEVIESADEITFLSDVAILKKDPVIKVTGEKNILLYYVNRTLNLTNVEMARSFLTYETLPPEYSQGFLSGLAIFNMGGVKVDWKTSLLASVILSLAIYLLGQFQIVSLRTIRNPRHLVKNAGVPLIVKKQFLSRRAKNFLEDLAISKEHIESRRFDKASDVLEDIQEQLETLKQKEKTLIIAEMDKVRHDMALLKIREDLDEAKRNMRKDDHNSVKILFQKIMKEYAYIQKESGAFLRRDIDKLADFLNKHFIGSLVESAHSHLEKGDIRNAASAYKKIQILYKKGSPSVRTHTHNASKDLHEKIRRVILRT